METHPIPRQITTFEFKLIGFMTVKQFGFVLLSGVFGYLIFLAIPIQILNIVVGFAIFCVGLLFAFVPVNDRPLDVFVKNLFRRLNSPTQYIFHKKNNALPLFDELYFDQDPHVVLAHIDSKEKLLAYVNSQKNSVKTVGTENTESHKGRISGLFQTLDTSIPQKPSGSPITEKTRSQEKTPNKKGVSNEQRPLKHPVFTGVVINTKKIPLPGVLIYVQDAETKKPLRILKTNPHGVFATFQPLKSGTYAIDLVDPSGNHMFSPSTITLHNDSQTSFEFVSKETP